MSSAEDCRSPGRVFLRNLQSSALDIQSSLAGADRQWSKHLASKHLALVGRNGNIVLYGRLARSADLLAFRVKPPRKSSIAAGISPKSKKLRRQSRCARFCARFFLARSRAAGQGLSAEGAGWGRSSPARGAGTFATSLQHALIGIVVNRVGDRQLAGLALEDCRCRLRLLALHAMQRHSLGTVRTLKGAVFQGTTVRLRCHPSK